MLHLATFVLLIFSGISVLLSFGGSHAWLASPWSHGVLWCFLGVNLFLAVRALIRLRWVSLLFHTGAALLVVGGALSENAVSGYLPLTQGESLSSLYSSHFDEEVAKLDFQVLLKDFEIDTYPNSHAPRQYTSTLLLKDFENPGAPITAKTAVNAPLRFKGWTIYQMDYQRAQTPYSPMPMIYSILLFKRDPGVPYVFAAYGILVLGAFLLLVRTFWRKEAPRGA